MSLPPLPYSPHSSSYPGNPGNPTAHPDTETPPPPPPKPTSHEASRKGTPHTASPIPVPPPSDSIAGETYGPQHGPSESIPDAVGSPSNPPQPPSIEDGWLPDIVNDKSIPDLRTILSSPAHLTALSTLHPSHPATTAHLTTLLTTNKSLTTTLTALESHLSHLRTSTESTLLTHQSLELAWRKKQSEMDAELAPWSPKALYQRLVAGIAEQEAVCAAVEESFLDGEGGLASEREVVEWVRRVRGEGARLEGRREARSRWDEGRVGGWR
ncbi:hypothetical protein FQN50_007846 [Emmonsiellopsis sp. PD_5]|nr:hypothetical protein FQN50_007846 [Emmonsiellopsis sp. PD_5]